MVTTIAPNNKWSVFTDMFYFVFFGGVFLFGTCEGKHPVLGLQNTHKNRWGPDEGFPSWKICHFRCP